MTDFRHCDGPNCDVIVNVNYLEVPWNGWVTLERGRGEEELHFHDGKCLNEWTLENMKGK